MAKKPNVNPKGGEPTQLGFVDDVYMTLANDIEKIRTCKPMYISALGTQGGLHLFKEIFNNALDECMNPNGIAKVVYVSFNEDNMQFKVSDEGRGIPFDELVDTVTTSHKSTKFIKKVERSKYQTGMNGVGMTVVAALTDYLSVTSCRGGKEKAIEFINGELKEYPEKKGSAHGQGLLVSFIPSENELGHMDLTYDLVESYLRKISYILPEHMGIKVYYQRDDGSKKPFNALYEHKGLPANVDFISSSLEFPPVEVKFSTDAFDMEMAFSYDKTLDDTIIESYCNAVVTVDGGKHETAAIQAVCSYFTRAAKNLDPNSKYEVTYDDCKKGLILAVNAWHREPILEGQHKTKAANDEFLTIGRGKLVAALTAEMEHNPALLRKVISYLRQMARIRLEAHKIKGISTKKPTSYLDDAEIKEFTNISDRHYKGYKEIYIAEGRSANGALRNCRNPKNQALFSLIGVIDNVFNYKLSDTMSKELFQKLVKVLGCDVGPNMDITKLRWNKIIICCDADTDGDNIASLVICFFYLCMRPIIEKGLLYRAAPPLYILKEDSFKKFYHGDAWFYDKNEFANMVNNVIASSVKVCLEPSNCDGKNVIELSKRDLMQWLKDNSDYQLELVNLEKRAASDGKILEHVCYAKLLSNGDEFKFKEFIEKLYPEMHYDVSTSVLTGSINRAHFSLICDSIFMHSARRFMQVLSKSPSLYVWVKNKNSDDKFDRMTIGEFLTLMHRTYNVQVDQRLKGLGEAETDVLFNTVMNPKLRKLYRITMKDAEAAFKTLELIHGKGETLQRRRREWLNETDISYADIDN